MLRAELVFPWVIMSEKLCCGPGFAIRRAFAICLVCAATTSFLLSIAESFSEDDACPGLKRATAGVDERADAWAEDVNTLDETAAATKDPFLNTVAFLEEGEGFVGVVGGFEIVCVVDPDTVPFVELVGVVSISRMSAVVTPTIFSLLSGESPHVERDSCASVYRQSALFRRQFEHGIPLSHLRLFWRHRLQEVATLCRLRVFWGRLGKPRSNLGRGSNLGASGLSLMGKSGGLVE